MSVLHLQLAPISPSGQKREFIQSVIPSVFAGAHEGSSVCSMAEGPGRELPERAGRGNCQVLSRQKCMLYSTINSVMM